MHRILQRISDGSAVEVDLERLESLCHMVRDSSLCGLGATAPNPVLNTLRYFRAEYLAHIRERRCPAGVCRITEVPVAQLGEELLQRIRAGRLNGEVV
jgi:bidirectional [NiFe] hydrogenase diaphorase subunit